MKLVEIYKELEELSGMKNIHYLVYGNFINLVEYRMDLIGIFGALNKRLHGRKISTSG